MRPVLPLLLLLAACGGDKDGTTPTPTDGETPTTEPTGHTGTEPDLDLTGQYGSIVLGHWPADAYYEADHYAYGLFVSDDDGITNLAACLLVGGLCVDAYPAEGGSTEGHLDFTFLDTVDFVDAGTTVMAGSTVLTADRTNGFPLYLGTPDQLDPTGGLSLDGDLAPYTGTADFTSASEIVVTSPDPGAPLTVGPGQATLDLAWAPGEGDVVLEAGGKVFRLADDGAEAFPIAELGLQAPFDFGVVILSRITNARVDANGNTVNVQTRSDQWLYVDYRDTTGWTELPLGSAIGETCGDALALPPLAAGRYYGDLATAADDHDLGDGNPLTTFATEGFDGAVAVTLTAGQTLTATFTQTVFDGAIYLLDAGCDPAAALAGEDLTLDGEAEVLTWTAPTDGTWVLVLDGWTDGGAFTLELEVL